MRGTKRYKPGLSLKLKNGFKSGFRKGGQVESSPSLEKFSCKKSQREDQGKNLTPPRFFKKFKRKPQRGYQRIF
jgi:hypothetical protein